MTHPACFLSVMTGLVPATANGTMSRYHATPGGRNKSGHDEVAAVNIKGGWYKAVIADFLDAIENGRNPAIPGEEALETQRIIETIITKGV